MEGVGEKLKGLDLPKGDDQTYASSEGQEDARDNLPKDLPLTATRYGVMTPGD